MEQAWKNLGPEARAAIEEAGWSPSRDLQAPPGLGGIEQLTPQEYHGAVSELWKDADAATQKVLKAAGIEPPRQEADESLTPRKALQKVMQEYKQLTAEHRGLIAKKAALQVKTEKLKQQFHQSIADLGSLTKEIEEKEQAVEKAQERAREQIKGPQAPAAVEEITAILKQAGIQLTPELGEQICQHIAQRPELDLEMESVWGVEAGTPAELLASGPGPAYGPARRKSVQRESPLEAAPPGQAEHSA